MNGTYARKGRGSFSRGKLCCFFVGGCLFVNLFVRHVLLVGVVRLLGRDSKLVPPRFSSQCPRSDPDAAGADAYFASQQGQDRIVFDAFYRQDPLCNGVVLEIGAKDGIDGSNAFFFEQVLGWKSFSVEGDARHFRMLVENRPLATNIWAAVSSVYGEAEWVSDGIVSGGQSGLRQVDRSGMSTDFTSVSTVRTTPLSGIIEHFQLTHVDVMSIDIEGAELDALKTVDFSKITIDIIVLECMPWRQSCLDVRAFLSEKGFVLWRDNHDKGYPISCGATTTKGGTVLCAHTGTTDEGRVGTDDFWVRPAFLESRPWAADYEYTG